MVSPEINITVKWDGGKDADLDGLAAFLESCKTAGLPGNTRLRGNAGDSQKDGRFLILEASAGDRVGGR